MTDVLISPDDFFKEPEEKTKLFTHLEKYQKAFVKLPPNILTELMLAVIYLKMNNQDGAEVLIRRAIFRDPQAAFFNSCIISKKDWNNNKSSMIGALSMALKYVRTRLINTKLSEMFVHYFMLYENEDLNQALRLLTEREIDKSVVEKELKGVKEGKAFFPFWYFLLYPSTTELERFDLAENYFDYFYIKNHFENVGWVMMSYFPANEVKRKIIYAQMNELYQNQGPVAQDLWVKLLSQEVLKRQVEKTITAASKPLFNLKRKIYVEILNKKVACAYAFFQLSSLGDEQKEYLDKLNSCPD